MHWSRKYQSSFNGYPKQLPARVSRPEYYAGLKPTLLKAIARGAGASYGDAALNQGGEIILTERLDRFLDFDEQQGIISVEAGITLAKILEVIVARGWFLPVVPGTASVSVGGCIAADIHGKNHISSGSWGQHVLEIELITGEEQRVLCSPTHLPDLFWATLGGMGLTGIIGAATLKLKRIETAYLQVQYQSADCLEQLLDYFLQQDVDDEYQVAWLDALNRPLGRGIFMKAHHVHLLEIPSKKKSHAFLIPRRKPYSFPFYLPNGLLHPCFMKLFNRFYYPHLVKKDEPLLLDYFDYFYPLDRIKHWPRAYGKRGFIQYQCVCSAKSAYSLMPRLLEILHTSGYPIYLAVLKRFGGSNLAPLSFPMPGLTLALDIPIVNRELFSCLDRLDESVIAAGGRVYLAKDARLKPAAFRAMYPRYPEWLTVKEKWDPTRRWNSDLAKRLEIGCISA